MNEFAYLSQKIDEAKFEHAPFKHILIEDFLSEEHLQNVLQDQQIHFEEVRSTEELVERLFEKGYKIQNFPGCTSDLKEYLNHYNNSRFPANRKGTPIESYGITFRLHSYNNSATRRLVEYLNGAEFKSMLEKKFEIEEDTTIVTKGRHDPCVGIRATPIAESMLALVLCDLYLRDKAQNSN